MTMPAWPDTGVGALPTHPLLNTLHETFPDVLLRTEMDAGPAKTRQRYTAGVAGLQCEMMLGPVQVATLEDFYSGTLGGGVEKFTWAHPRSGDTKVFRFVKPPQISQASKGAFKAALDLEILPETAP